MLTNFILKHFSADIDESLFEQDTESDEAQKFNEKIEIAAREDFVEMFSSNKEPLKKYFHNLSDHEEKDLFLLIATRHHFIEIQNESKKELETQYQQCQDFLHSDMCHRDIKLKKLVEKELKKLDEALQTDIVYSSIKAFERFYKRKYPTLSKTNLAVKISESLHYLEIYKDEPFMTLEEADDHAYRTAQKSGKAVILQRLNRYLDKY